MTEALLPPPWLRPLLRGRPRAASVRRALDPSRPWPTTRAALAAAVLADPAASRRALEALRRGAEHAGDATLAARLLVLEARAIHRSGGLDEALEAYERAERRLEEAGVGSEAATLSVARVDALATAGRVPEALALADRTLRRLPRARSLLRASLGLNRGNALRLAGDLEAARRAYRAAERDLEALGHAHGAGVARLNAGVVLVEAGDVEAARAAFERGAAEFEARGLHDLAREARTNLAHADAQAGRLGDAVRALERLAEEHRASGLPRREALCRLDLAAGVLRAGDAPSAEREALRAAAAFAAVHARAERSEALWLAARAAAGEAPARAAAHLRAARRAADAAGRPAVALRCDVLSADLACRRGASPGAAALSSLARRARALGQRALEADLALLAGGDALARGRFARARTSFEEALRAGRGHPWARAAADAGLAAVEASGPRGRDAALRRLRRVTGFLETVGGDLPGAWLRAAFAAERLDPFLARVELLLARDARGDREEAEAVLDSVARRRPAPHVRRPDLAPRFLRARRRLEALYDRLARGDAPSRGGAAGSVADSTLERRARGLEREIADAWRAAERAGPSRREADRRAAPATPPDAAVVRLWRHAGRARGLVRVGAGVGPGLDLGPADDLDALTESLRLRARRWALLRTESPEALDADGFERVLSDLAARLLGPLGAAAWPSRVRVVADPRLPDVPWEILPFEGGRLGEARRVVRTPVAGRVRRRARGEGVVVVAVGEPDLPGVAREAEAVAHAAGATRVLVGADATRAALAAALRDARVVHVAGHGWPATEAPPLGGVRVADGWFGGADLPAEGVACDLVVLAACRTGRESGPASRAWGGLATALLEAGARRVAWTVDDVHDATTGRLMTRFHEARREADDVSAFGRALAATAREERHPAAVLPFRLSGVDA